MSKRSEMFLFLLKAGEFTKSLRQQSFIITGSSAILRLMMKRIILNLKILFFEILILSTE